MKCPRYFDFFLPLPFYFMSFNDIQQHLDKANRAQINGIAALYHLCIQVETNHFDQ
jgi:hypothetical protein